MAARLDIECIEIRNFLSYGDYVTRLEVANYGPVLILGEVDETDSSNGAGKSSLLTAFIWGIFGRTITNPKPGDKVVNWYNKKNCYVKIKTTDGWEIIRTRNVDGHSELIVIKDNDDATKSTSTNAQKQIKELFGLDYEIFTSSVFCGQFGKSFLEMTPTKRKEAVERLLGLDRLNKHAEAAKEKYKQVENDQKVSRSKADLHKHDLVRQHERIAHHVDLEAGYEQERREKIQKFQLEMNEVQQQLDNNNIPDLEELEKKWLNVASITDKRNQYQDKVNKNNTDIESLESHILSAQESLSDYDGWPYEILDIEDLKEKHQLADLAASKLQELKVVSEDLRVRTRCLQQEVNERQKKIDEWEDKSGTVCLSCGQDVSIEHAHKNIAPYLNEMSFKNDELEIAAIQYKSVEHIIDQLTAVQRPEISLEEAKRVGELNSKIEKDMANIRSSITSARSECANLEAENVSLQTSIKEMEELLEQSRPGVTLEQAQQILLNKTVLEKRKTNISERLEEISKTVNPYCAIIADLHKTVKQANQDVTECEEEIKQLDTLFAHYKYIYRSYSDRRKIKKWLLSELIPFLNDRVHYYLSKLDIDIDIKFSSTLDAETDRWGYEFCSGGERKRIDLAIMFGLYDLYMSIYGQQCNIMVLDEVDSRLDKKGVEAFCEIVHDISTNNDNRPCPSTIFVISHKQELKSMFPSQITIKKHNSFSVIDQTAFLINQT